MGKGAMATTGTTTTGAMSGGVGVAPSCHQAMPPSDTITTVASVSFGARPRQSEAAQPGEASAFVATLSA